MFLPPRNRRCFRSAPEALFRIGTSLLRARSRRFALSRVKLEETNARITADLRTPFGLQLYRYGFCDPAASLVRALLAPGDSFVDGGANVGLFTLVGADAVGKDGRVLACEPDPETMELLRSNVALNGFDWVELHQVALAEHPGEMPFISFGAGSGFSSFAPAHEVDATRHRVVTTTLDELAGEVPRLHLIKLDIEGAEVRALRGAVSLLETARPIFLVEVEPAHLERQGASVAELATLFEDAGYVSLHFDANQRDLRLRRLEGDWLPRTQEIPNVVAYPRERTEELDHLTV